MYVHNKSTTESAEIKLYVCMYMHLFSIYQLSHAHKLKVYVYDCMYVCLYVCMYVYIYDHILHLLTNRAVSAPQGKAREVPRKHIQEESGLLGQNSHLPG